MRWGPNPPLLGKGHRGDTEMPLTFSSNPLHPTLPHLTSPHHPTPPTPPHPTPPHPTPPHPTPPHPTPPHPTPPHSQPPAPCVTFRQVAVSLRGPGQSPVPCFPSRTALGQCFLTAAAACVPCGVISALAEPCRWRTGSCQGRFTVFAAHYPAHSGRLPHASPHFRVREAQCHAPPPPPPPKHTHVDSNVRGIPSS